MVSRLTIQNQALYSFIDRTSVFGVPKRRVHGILGYPLLFNMDPHRALAGIPNRPITFL